MDRESGVENENAPPMNTETKHTPWFPAETTFGKGNGETMLHGTLLSIRCHDPAMDIIFCSLGASRQEVQSVADEVLNNHNNDIAAKIERLKADKAELITALSEINNRCNAPYFNSEQRWNIEKLTRNLIAKHSKV